MKFKTIKIDRAEDIGSEIEKAMNGIQGEYYSHSVTFSGMQFYITIAYKEFVNPGNPSTKPKDPRQKNPRQ